MKSQISTHAETLRNLLSYLIESLGSYYQLTQEAVLDIFYGRIKIREVTKQIVIIGVNSLPIVILTAIFTGMVLALQTAYGLQRFGAKNYVGNIVGLAMTRELGPVLSAIMLAGRVGAGIAAEISSMVVSEQIDAMRTLGASPSAKLIAPRILAATIVMPLLIIVADVIGVAGGLLVAVLELQVTSFTFYRSLIYTLVIRDIIDGLIKGSIFGFLLVSIACFKGMNTDKGTVGVGNATTSAVVTSTIVIFIANFFITKLLILINFN
ncbi:MAG TPA: ABC transporter permease [Oligoflexia bacterium]|nr:ABC transporter permease [Oligoflexia bacterium]HMP26546.1 ABC transporter permease [Oligoflexia bacterium]